MLSKKAYEQVPTQLSMVKGGSRIGNAASKRADEIADGTPMASSKALISEIPTMAGNPEIAIDIIMAPKTMVNKTLASKAI